MLWTCRRVQKILLSQTFLANFSENCLRFANPAEAATNFERPFTPLPPLRSPRNFGNARFRRFANFDFLTPKIFCSEKVSDRFFGFSLFSADFRGARLFLTSASSSSRFVALDGQIFRSVRRWGLNFRFFTIRASTCGEIYGEGRGTPIRQQHSEPGPPTRVFLVFKQD